MKKLEHKPHVFGDIKRCYAKTRAGGRCGQPAMREKARCRLHGGKSTGPKTEEGKRRIGQAHYKHGKYTVDAKRNRLLITGLSKQARLLYETVQ